MVKRNTRCHKKITHEHHSNSAYNRLDEGSTGCGQIYNNGYILHILDTMMDIMETSITDKMEDIQGIINKIHSFRHNRILKKKITETGLLRKTIRIFRDPI